jgi:uncharacterized protein
MGASGSVVWVVAHPRLSGAELFELDETGPEITMRGWVVARVDGVGCAVSYQIDIDRQWVTRRARIRLDSEPDRTLEIDHDGRGTWTVNDVTRSDLAGCLDIDLGISPSTNTLPIRRLQLDVGQAESLDAVWVRFPDLTVDVLSQTYARQAESVYRYRSNSFQADLEVDERGVVVRYGEDLWQTVNGR